MAAKVKLVEGLLAYFKRSFLTRTLFGQQEGNFVRMITLEPPRIEAGLKGQRKWALRIDGLAGEKSNAGPSRLLDPGQIGGEESYVSGKRLGADDALRGSLFPSED